MLLGLENVTFSFGARTILDEVNWQIYKGQKIGLIGLNGVGKSTLLKLMDGQFSPEKGRINKAKNLKIGFLNQDSLSFESSDSIISIAMSAFEEAQAAGEKLEILQFKLEKDPHNEELQNEYNNTLLDFETYGGYEYQHLSEIVLEGLGFKSYELEKPFNTFSGGWRMRVLLAKMILQKPDVLLLDEPTNHLDLPAIEWLEKYIQSYPGAIVIISHDKTFINQMCDEILELDRRTLTSYKGDYDYYVTEKALRQEQLEKEYDNQQQFIKQQERFIERFKAKASKATQAKSVQKKLDRLDRIEMGTVDSKGMNLRFKVQRPSGKIVMEMDNITKSYPNKVLLQSAKAMINRGDKIGLVGANGVGKTTLLHIIDQSIDFNGNLKLGHHVDKSLYSQHQIESLHIENEILQELMASNVSMTENEIRKVLGCFLFSGDDVYKKIKILSGGEKSRVALAKILISSANFLLLDEPTNHLDMISKDILIDSLNDYEGTYIMVSHDRDFIMRTANKIWEIVDNDIKEFPGNYEEWNEYKIKQQQSRNQESKNNQTTAKAIVQKNTDNKAWKERQKEKKKLENQLKKLEEQLENFRAKESSLLTKLGDPDLYNNHVEWSKADNEYKAITEKIPTIEKEFEQLFESLLDFEDV